MYTFDHNLCLWLNFDGGAVMDTLMLAASNPVAWARLYLLIFYMVWRKDRWRGLLLFVLAVAIALGLADMVAGIFKGTALYTLRQDVRQLQEVHHQATHQQAGVQKTT